MNAMMPIRPKIVSISVALLIVFGIVIGVSAVLQDLVTNQTAGRTRYHEPLIGAIADFDVIGYERIAAAAPVGLVKPQQDEINAKRGRAEIVQQRLRGDLSTAAGVIASAVNDDRLRVEERTDRIRTMRANPPTPIGTASGALATNDHSVTEPP